MQVRTLPKALKKTPPGRKYIPYQSRHGRSKKSYAEATHSREKARRLNQWEKFK